MRKLLILTGVVLTLIVLYPKESMKIVSKVGGIVSLYFNVETVKSSDLVKRNGIYIKRFTDVPFTGREVNYFADGQLNSKGHFKGGKRDGIWEVYFDNGQLKSKQHYKDGKKNGLGKEYHINGQLSSKGYFKDGEENGPWEFYYKNGQLNFKGHYNDGKKEGLWEASWVNGQLSNKGNWKGGKQVGFWKYYEKDGTVNEEYTGTYRNGERVSRK